jgi:hypothetical protein
MTKKFRTAISWLQSDNPKSKIGNPKLVGLVELVINLKTAKQIGVTYRSRCCFERIK